MEAPTPLRDLHWTPLEGPGTKTMKSEDTQMTRMGRVEQKLFQLLGRFPTARK